MAEQDANEVLVTALTPYEADAMRIIQELLDKEGHPPSLQQLANELGLNTRSAGFRVVTRLVAKGWLRRLPGRGAYNIQVLRRVPTVEDLGTMDVKAVADVAVEALAHLRRVMGDCGVVYHLADRLDKALKGDLAVELTVKGQEACDDAHAR